ncbi:MAG: undecaprenyl-diphosphate phosphatase [Oscillospiraceae bacterium]|nr:undecaprenyl-diphosphate phosphatase [Oscillospiraceae bacterium]
METMQMYESIILGIVQGITEFLPISSSAHLRIVPWMFFGWDQISDSFDVALHFGTFIAMVLFFFKDWLRLFKGAYKNLRGEKTAEGRMFWYLVVATIPGGIIGLLFSMFMPENEYWWPIMIAIALILMGIILYIADKKCKSVKSYEDLDLKTTFLIGLSQGLAFISGVSRSGATMTAGRLLGVDRQSIARFSFMLATPITFAAVVFEARYFDFSWPSIIGVIVSFIVSLGVIKFLLSYLRKGSFKIFAIYRVIFGAIIIATFFLR